MKFALLLLLIFLPHIAYSFLSLATVPSSRKPTTTAWGVNYRGPGETQAEPMSLATNSRNELANAIVTAAIFYMTVTVNIEKAFDRWLPKSNATIGVFNGVQAFPNGIKYQEIIMGSGETIEDGDFFEADCRMFYNGLEVGYDLLGNSNGVGFINNRISVKFQKVNKFPLDGVIEGVKGLKVGGRRKIVLPASLAFGEAGFTPYIPANAAILYDVQLLSVTKLSESSRIA